MRKMARDGMARRFFHEGRLDLGAQLRGTRTAIAEPAAARQAQRTRHYAGNGVEPFFLGGSGARQ